MTSGSNTLPPTPVTVLSGYLGAGKTTLINKLLTAQTDRRLAILVNDFGEINVDASLIREHQGRTISLTNGCICCSIAGDLTSALRDVLAIASESPDPDIEQIIIEASGVADPAKIAMHAQGWPDLRLDGIVVVVDAIAIRSLAQDRYVGTTVVRQITSGDVLIVSKVDLTEGTAVSETMTWLRHLAPNAPIIVDSELHSATEYLLEGPGRGHQSLSLMDDEEAASGHFATTTWYPDHIVDQRLLVQALEHMSNAVPRCKGWVRFADQPDTPRLVQAIGSRVEIQQGNKLETSVSSDSSATNSMITHTSFLSLIFLSNLTTKAEILSQLDGCIVPTKYQERHASL